ncbi:hypothetical protein MASR2M48_30150 [Spirochaetota bacterium]
MGIARLRWSERAALALRLAGADGANSVRVPVPNLVVNRIRASIRSPWRMVQQYAMSMLS